MPVSIGNFSNFAYGILAAGIDSTATVCTLTTGHAARFTQDAPFKATIWNVTDYADPMAAYWNEQAEVVLVTAKTGSDFTIVRAQEGTTARNLNQTRRAYAIRAGVTADLFNTVIPAAIGGGGGGSGTVTSVSVTTANGVSGTVDNATTTPAITITLGDIVPSSVASSGIVTGSNLSGLNTGDNAPNSLYSGLVAASQSEVNAGSGVGYVSATALGTKPTWQLPSVNVAAGGTRKVGGFGETTGIPDLTGSWVDKTTGGKQFVFNVGVSAFAATSGIYSGKSLMDATTTWGYNLPASGVPNDDVQMGIGMESRYLNLSSGISSEWYAFWQSNVSGLNYINRRPFQINVENPDSGDATRFASQVDVVWSADTFRISSYSAAVANSSGGTFTEAGTFIWNGKLSTLTLSSASGGRANLIVDEWGDRASNKDRAVVGIDYATLALRNSTSGYTSSDGLQIKQDGLNASIYNTDTGQLRLGTIAGGIYNELMWLTAGQRVLVGFNGGTQVAAGTTYGTDTGNVFQVKGGVSVISGGDTELRIAGGSYPGIKIISSGLTGGVDLVANSTTSFLFRINDNKPLELNTAGSLRLTVHSDITCNVPLKLANAYVATPPTCTGYVTVKDSAGTTYKLLAGT